MATANRPDILFIMCDQFRFDCIHALGNQDIHTPISSWRAATRPT